MINFAECLRYYAKHIDWSIYRSNKDLCEYYQNQCRYYKD